MTVLIHRRSRLYRQPHGSCARRGPRAGGGSITSPPASTGRWRGPRCSSLGDCEDRSLVAALIAEHEIDAIVHSAGSIVVPNSVCDDQDTAS
jgi:hypothetical protein